MECGPCPVFESNYALAFTLQLRKITVKPQSGQPKSAWKITAEHDSFRRLGHGLGLDWSAGTRRSRFTPRATGPTLGQSKYLPSCRTKGFPTSANLESKLAVRALMWSAKKGTPKSADRRLFFRIASFYCGRPLLVCSAIGQLTKSVGVASCASRDCWDI